MIRQLSLLALTGLVISSSAVAHDEVWSVANLWGGAEYTVAGDFNGDGLTDVASADNSIVHMKLSTGAGFNSINWPVANSWGGFALSGDFNGDGLDDIASPQGGQIYMKLSTGSSFNNQVWTVANNWGSPGYTFVGDFNGDGLDDIASASNGNVYLKLSTGSGFQSQTWSVSNLWSGDGWTFSGDFNGDGFADIASVENDTVYFKMSNGSEFISITGPISSPNPFNWSSLPGWTWTGSFSPYSLGDQAVTLEGGLLVTYVANVGIVGPTTFGEFSHSGYFGGPPYGGSGFIFAGDFNGDGIDDIASFDLGTAYMKLGETW